MIARMSQSCSDWVRIPSTGFAVAQKTVQASLIHLHHIENVDGKTSLKNVMKLYPPFLNTILMAINPLTLGRKMLNF